MLKFLRRAGLLAALIRGWKYDWKVARLLEKIQVRIINVEKGGARVNIRRSHLLATEHKLAELKTDARVVEGGRDHGYKRRNHTLALSCGRYHRRDEGRDQF